MLVGGCEHLLLECGLSTGIRLPFGGRIREGFSFVSDSITTPVDQPAIVYDFDPRNAPPEFLRAIGLVAAASAQTEHILQDLIGALLNIDNVQSVALAAHMSFPLKESVIRTLAELEAPDIPEVDAIDELLDAVKAALDKRNIIVHNALAMHPTNGEVYSYREKARGSLQAELKIITVEEIEKDATAIYEVGMDIMRFMMSRGIGARTRTTPTREPIKRGKGAREARRNGGV